MFRSMKEKQREDTEGMSSHCERAAPQNAHKSYHTAKEKS